MRNEILKFKAYCPQREYKLFGKTFASWMGRVDPLPFVETALSPRQQRIANARDCLAGGMEEDVVKCMVFPDEWNEVTSSANQTI
jgi:hypothetical protein